MIGEVAVGIEERYEIEMEMTGMDTHDIHLLCRAHPKLSPGPMSQIFKSTAAREIYTRKSSVKSTSGVRSS
jgi:hypothetical protein